MSESWTHCCVLGVSRTVLDALGFPPSRPVAALYHPHPSGLPVGDGSGVPVFQCREAAGLAEPLVLRAVAACGRLRSSLVDREGQAVPHRFDPGCQLLDVRGLATAGHCPLIVGGLGDDPGDTRRLPGQIRDAQVSAPCCRPFAQRALRSREAGRPWCRRGAGDADFGAVHVDRTRPLGNFESQCVHGQRAVADAQGVGLTCPLRALLGEGAPGLTCAEEGPVAGWLPGGREGDRVVRRSPTSTRRNKEACWRAGRHAARRSSAGRRRFRGCTA